MMINYAELYGLEKHESDFTGAIKRTTKVKHLSESFCKTILEIHKDR